MERFKMNPIIHIIHIEDSPKDAELVQAKLEEAGLVCRITCVQTYAEFDAGLQQDEPDLILADYRLPMYDGMSALRLAQELRPEAPFIFVSGTMGEEAAIEALKQGATDYVLKHNMARLEPAVKRALQQAKDRRERKQAEEELRDSEVRFRTFIDHAADAFFLHDNDEGGTILDMNRQACESLGYSREELVEMTCYDIDAGLDPVSMEQLEARMQNGKTIAFETLHRRKDGTVFPVEVRARPLRQSGRLLAIALVRDVTERKQAEQERLANVHFLESMDRINRAMQGTNDLEQMMSDVLAEVLSIFDCDRAYLMHPCDPEAASWSAPMERTKPEYPGAHAEGFEAPMDPDIARVYRLLLESDGPVKFGPDSEHPLPREMSRRFGYKSKISMALYPKNSAPWVFGLHQCSYPRVWTQQEERLLQEIGRRLADDLTSLMMYQNLQKSEERFRTIFQNSPISIWEEDFSGVKNLFDGLREEKVTDIETYFAQHPEAVRQCADLVKIVDVNRAAVEIHGAANKKELLAGLIDTFTPESFDTFRQELICLWNGCTEMTSDGVVKTLAGDRRNVTVYFSLCPGHEETFTKVIVSLIDITERKRLEEELIRAQKLESMGLLAGGIAHDFNNILTVMLGNVSMAKTQVAAEDDIFKMLSEAEMASMRAQALTQQLLTFAKGGAPVKETTSIKDLLKESSSFALHGSKSACEFTIAEDLWPIDMDVGQMSQVINNIIINSNQAMPQGGTIQVAAKNLIREDTRGLPVKSGRYIKISITDQGVGILEKDLLKIFDPYFSTKYEGSGLGLSTAYSIIKKHNGHVTVESQVGVGTTFHIYLPASERAVPKKEEVKLVKGQGRILVMDDEAMLKEIVGKMLEKLGYEFDFAENGAEAIEMYKRAQEAEKQYDAVILDLTIPGGMGGKEAIKNLLEIDPEINAIVSSGYSDDPVLANFQKYGFKGMMPKPFGYHSLGKVLQDVLKDEKD
jgi:PAS domain S-box-containing protein